MTTGELWMPDDAVVEALARSIHQHYLDDAGGPDDAHPARRGWSDLAPDLQAQNLNQARDNIVKVHRVGFVVVASAALDGRSRVETFADEVVESLSSDEHDRWAQQKRAQGYRYGPERVDDGPDKRHPDLLTWAELDEATREKDRAPVRRIPSILWAAGLAIVPSR